MTDHPLTPDPVKQYIDEQKIEIIMNTGINKILRERPSDALSALAVYLTSNAEKKAIFSKFECEETIIGGKYHSFNTQVFIDFAGEVKCRHIHNYTFENEDYTDSDEGNQTFMEQVIKAMEIITNEINPLLAGQDLSIVKKTDMILQRFFEEKYALSKAEGEGEETPEDPIPGKIAIKVASEALIHGIAK